MLLIYILLLTLGLFFLAEFVAHVQHNPKYRVEHGITEINNESVVANNVCNYSSTNIVILFALEICKF